MDFVVCNVTEDKMLEEIKQRIIESDLTPQDMRIVLDILKDFEEQKEQ